MVSNVDDTKLSSIKFCSRDSGSIGGLALPQAPLPYHPHRRPGVMGVGMRRYGSPIESPPVPAAFQDDKDRLAKSSP